MFKIDYDLYSRVNKVDINTSNFTYQCMKISVWSLKIIFIQGIMQITELHLYKGCRSLRSKYWASFSHSPSAHSLTPLTMVIVKPDHVTRRL